MAKLDLALIVRTVDQATRPLRNIQRTVNQVGRQTGLDRVGRDIRRTGRQMRAVGGEALIFARNLGGIAVALGAVSGVATLRAAGSMEQLRVAFTSMLGSEEAALDMVKQLTDFTAKTPFQLQGVGAAAKLLLGFGVASDDIIDNLQFLGDIASGAGIPLKDLAQIYGKTLAKGKAQTEELNQLSERGVPILQALVDLAADYGNEISKEDVYKAAERGTIKFATIEEALRRMTAEGGLFNNQMEAQSRTLFGLASTVRDNLFLAMVDVGNQIEKSFGVKAGMRQFIVWLGGLTAELKKPADAQTGAAREITRTIEDIVVVVGWLRAGLGKLADAIRETGLTGWAKEFGYVRLAVIALVGWLGKDLVLSVLGLIGPLGKLAVSLGRFAVLGSAFLLANPIAAAIAAIAGAAALLYFHWDAVVSFMKGTWSEIKEIFTLPDWMTDPAALGNALPAWMRGAGFDVNATGPGAGGPALEGPAAAAAGAHVNVGGEVRVRFDGLPRGATVDVKSDNPAVPLDVQSGYILAPG